MRISVQDESRFGLISVCQRGIVAEGVTPLCIRQYDYGYLWLYGIAGPLTCESFSEKYPGPDTVERLRKNMKDKIAEYNEIYGDSEVPSNKISGIIAEMSNDIVKNLTFGSYIKEYFS